MGKRDISIDALRGLAIWGVVIIHSTIGVESFYFNQFLGSFFKFCVPLFIFISGYFVYVQRDFIKNAYHKYLKRRFIKIGIPYFAATLLIAVFTHLSIKTLFFQLLTGTASVPYYFFIVIFQMYLLSGLTIYLYEKNRAILFYIALISILLYSGMYYLQLHFYNNIIVPYYMWQAPYYFFWFLLGVEFSAKGKLFVLMDNIRPKIYLIIFSLSFLLCLFETNYHISNQLPDGNYIAITSILWEFVAIGFFWKFRHYFVNKLFLILGAFSFGIFLVHKSLMDIIFNYFGVEKIPELTLFYAFIIIIGCLTFLIVLNFIKDSLITKISSNFKKSFQESNNKIITLFNDRFLKT